MVGNVENLFKKGRKKKGGRGREWRLKLNLKSEAAYVSQGFSYQIACAECLWMIKIASQGEREREGSRKGR